MRYRSRAAAVVGGVLLVALAGCSGEETSASVVSPANAQEASPPAAAPAPAQAPTAAPVPDAASAAPAATPAAPAAAAVSAPAAEGSVDVAELMEPGPLPDIVMGDANAPVTIVEYASMTCGHCAAFHVDTMPTIKKNYVDTGKAKVILREFPLDPRAAAAFMLARCAPGDRRDAMIDVLFRQQSSWARAQNASEALLNISKLAGFTQESFTACLNDKELQKKVVDTQQRGETEFGVSATPTLFVNGQRYPGAMGPAELGAVIDSML